VRAELGRGLRHPDLQPDRDRALLAAVALDRPLPEHRRSNKVHLHHRLVNSDQHQDA
jgi:hypothetical protein